MLQKQTPKNQSRHVTTAKGQATTEINVVNSEEGRTELKARKTVLAITILLTVVKQNLAQTKKELIVAILRVQTTDKTENQKLSTHPVRPVDKLTTPHRNASSEPMQQIDRLLGTENELDRVRIDIISHRTTQMQVSRLWP